MTDIDKLFTVKRTIGSDLTMDDPCNLWCSLVDWGRWRILLNNAREHTALALEDLQKTGSREWGPLDQRYQAWLKAWNEEPDTLTELAEDPRYATDAGPSLARNMELGKQLRNLLRDVDAATKKAGGISKVPGSSDPAKPGGLPQLPWWAWAGIAFVGYQLVKKNGSDL